jgi:hypothetical protein
MRLSYYDGRLIGIINDRKILVHELISKWQLKRHIRFAKYFDFDPIEIDDEENDIIVYDRKASA